MFVVRDPEDEGFSGFQTFRGGTGDYVEAIRIMRLLFCLKLATLNPRPIRIADEVVEELQGKLGEDEVKRTEFRVSSVLLSSATGR